MPGDASLLEGLPAESPEPDPGARRFIIWGDNSLARRLAGELTRTYSAQVTVIVASATANQAPEIAALEPDDGDPALRPVVLEAARLSPDVFRRAGLADAAALALLDQDDVANVDAALIAREVSRTVRIVARIFNPVLGEGLAAMLGDCGVLSGSEIAAPAFVAAALGDDRPTYLRLPEDLLPNELLVAAKRADVDDSTDPDDVVCGLAVTGGRADIEGRAEPVTLPAEEDTADLVLVRAYGSPPRPPLRPRRHPLRATRLLFNRKLRLALTIMAALLVAGTVTLAVVRHISPWQAAYLTIVTALGGANPELDTSGVAQLTEILLVVFGVALVPVVTVLVVDVVVNARLALAAGRLTEPVSGHIVVVGLGNLGTRVIRELHDFGVDVVAIDRSAQARGCQTARELGIPVIIGNANDIQTLLAASVQTCRALVMLCTDDLANLETALLGREVHRRHQQSAAAARPADGAAPPGALRVVLRLFDEEFAGRVKRAFDFDISRSVSYLAAPSFAAAMVGREVIGTISVGRRVLLIAEVPVGAGSQLEGRFCPEVNRPNEVRLIAVRTGRVGLTLWTLPQRRKLVRTDRLLVVATRAGLAKVLARAVGVPDPPPLIELDPPLPLLNIRVPRPDRTDSPS